ncbi:PREDICTED: uncharacterized protein LOC107881725 [Prunus mume]|uniref:Uncharacterized protein LOC107881725 n=1 Tax=Prunus mume TaxID=102107 RepID=A0ABM1LWD7_PRUMU|nr:PREDICTED: uncharacterized protein LOC107881725 [Prunus mume]
MAVVLKRGRVKRRIFDSIMLRRNPYVWLFETTGAAAPKYGNCECQKVLDMIPVPPQQASRVHSQNDGKHGGSMNRRPVALQRGRVKRWIFESIIDKFTGAAPNNSDDFKSCMLRWNPYVWLFETTAAAAPKSGNSECQKVDDMIPVPPQQASREHEHDGKHGGSMKRGRVKRQILESIMENFTGAVPNNSDDFKSCMLRWNPYVWLFETTAAAAPEYGNSECQVVVDMIPVPPQQASRELEHSQNDGKQGGSVVNNITISHNTIVAANSTKVGISLSNPTNEVREIRNLVLVSTCLLLVCTCLLLFSTFLVLFSTFLVLKAKQNVCKDNQARRTEVIKCLM